jgi:hypothetical protein
VSKLSIAFKVNEMNRIILTITTTKSIVVCGRRNKFKNGPIIVNIRPIVADIKNLGNRITFSQKSGILTIPII